MSLIDVPGWSVKTTPVREDISHNMSKKRKRPTGDHRLESAEVNLVKLVAKLKDVKPDQETGRKATNLVDGKAQQKKRRKRSQVSEANVDAKQPDSKVTRSNHSTESLDNQKKPDSSPKSKKNAKTKLAIGDAPQNPNLASDKQPQASGLTALQKSMKQSLHGARFRLINENLYKSDSHGAHQTMRDDPTIFEEYHVGFRHQVLSWPTNPVGHYISKFASYPPRTVIADLGCGDAALARSLLPLEMSVLSFDLVSDNKYVVEADICSKIPLPGSEGNNEEKSTGEGQVVDVVVCALSLMGLNWLGCLREAWRILKPGGELQIAEVTSRFTDIEQFQNVVGSLGFRLKSKDETNSHFILFEYIKVPRKGRSEKDWIHLLSNGRLLKPCEYKRR
ncbi:methyltransferase-domain-containing protein [Crassisporium funariophilum]|nr:methyltransferase-domain-containing protein [Crassisporium funariophilum]